MFMRVSIVMMFVSLAAACEQTYQSNEIDFEHTGVASIIDGDTLDIRDNRYRFNGIDTPERGARCGNTNVYQKASLALSDLVGRKNVQCEPNGKKNGKRLIATCFVLLPNNQRLNLSEELVSMGWARDWPKYSNGRYAKVEKQARLAKEGIWGLECPDDLWGNRNYD